MESQSNALDPRCCELQPPVENRPLLTEGQAHGLAALFKTFSNGSRLRLLHALVRAEELCVTDLAKATAMKPQAVSNQLQRLVDRGIVGSRRERSNVFYRILDPCVPVLLDRGLCLLVCRPARSANAWETEAMRGPLGLPGHDQGDVVAVASGES
jgi:DNA-binding transcriptional ArsR family regulator